MAGIQLKNEIYSKDEGVMVCQSLPAVTAKISFPKLVDCRGRSRTTGVNIAKSFETT